MPIETGVTYAHNSKSPNRIANSIFPPITPSRIHYRTAKGDRIRTTNRVMQFRLLIECIRLKALTTVRSGKPLLLSRNRAGKTRQFESITWNINRIMFCVSAILRSAFNLCFFESVDSLKMSMYQWNFEIERLSVWILNILSKICL